MVEFQPYNEDFLMIFERNIRFKLEKALSFSPVVLLNGARQTGKTTLAKELAKARGYVYITFDDMEVLNAAQSDPQGFIKGLSKPVIIDEVQRVPELFLAIKKDVDENRIPGRYLLTGSANPLLIPRLGDSLAGRIVILPMYPLSQGEMHGKVEKFIDFAFSQEAPLFQVKESMSKNDLHSLIFKGGYPPVQPLDDEQARLWFESYMTTILYRDVTALTQVEKLSEFPKLLRLLAIRVGNLLNVSDIARASGLASSTLNRYLMLLEILFMVKFAPPWSIGQENRLVRSPKIYLFDSGFLSYLLSMNLDRSQLDAPVMGGVVENFIIAELFKQASWSDAQVNFFHYRTSSGVEVDIIIENLDGRVIGIEVKSGEKIGSDAFKGLKYLQEKIGSRFYKGIVLYTGDKIIPYGDNLYAMPISSLWTQV